MNNGVIGTISIFAFTCVLFALRHFYLSIGRPKKSVYFTPKPRRNPELNDGAVTDDAWLLWTEELEKQANSWTTVDDGMSHPTKR
jgi:hypothetical protein